VVTYFHLYGQHWVEKFPGLSFDAWYSLELKVFFWWWSKNTCISTGQDEQGENKALTRFLKNEF